MEPKFQKPIYLTPLTQALQYVNENNLWEKLRIVASDGSPISVSVRDDGFQVKCRVNEHRWNIENVHMVNTMEELIEVFEWFYFDIQRMWLEDNPGETLIENASYKSRLMDFITCAFQRPDATVVIKTPCLTHSIVLESRRLFTVTSRGQNLYTISFPCISQLCDFLAKECNKVGHGASIDVIIL